MKSPPPRMFLRGGGFVFLGSPLAGELSPPKAVTEGDNPNRSETSSFLCRANRGTAPSSAPFGGTFPIPSVPTPFGLRPFPPDRGNRPLDKGSRPQGEG